MLQGVDAAGGVDIGDIDLDNGRHLLARGWEHHNYVRQVPTLGALKQVSWTPGSAEVPELAAMVGGSDLASW